MLKNYFLVTIRNLFKNSIYSFINIAGLAVGITCSILILLWVDDELSYNKFIPKTDRLYQVWINSEFNGEINSWTSLPCPTYNELKTADANIKRAIRTDWGGEHLLAVNDKKLYKKGYYVSEEFLEAFEFPLIQGDKSQVLDEPASIVLTESTARAIFDDEDPLGKTVRLDNLTDLQVSGILKDIPGNSTFEFDYLTTWATYTQLNEWVKNSEDNWGNYSFQMFVELNDPANEENVETSIADMLYNHGETNPRPYLFLHPMTRWRLHSNFENGKESGGMIEYVNLFTIIAVIILLIACINFMNLATARSERRAKEVGIRKCVGSEKKQLIFQFLGESIFISVIAFLVALMLAMVLLPFYNDLVDKELLIDITSLKFWIFTAAIILITGIVSGSYPAFYLSAFKPVVVLKGKVKVGKKASTPRKILVTLQFGISILLILGTLVILEQINMVKNRQLGYEQVNLITVDYNRELGENYKTVKDELLRTGVVESVTKSNSPITNIYSNNFLGWPGKPEELRVLFTTIATEYDYTKTMGIKVLEGRDFSEDFKSDTSAILVNKAALEVMNLKNPIGTELDLWGGKRTLIGVVDNVLMGSPFQEVKPMFMIMMPDWTSSVTIRLLPSNDLQGSIAKVEEVFNRLNPSHPFDYSFVDVEFQEKFKTINLTSTLANLFAVLAIVITGLGLFGLAAFTAEQRTKEIGIRKVLGASISGIVALMCKDFSRLVIIAFLLSAPLAWYLLNLYLQRYPIRIEIGWWVFPVTGLIALLFALTIVATQALRAAYANPVNSLRSE